MTELASAYEELASLWTKEVEAHHHANQAKKQLHDLAERTRSDAEATKRQRKEQDELLQAMGGLRMEHNLAHQESTNARE